MSRRLIVGLILIVATAIIAGCNGDTDDESEPANGDAAELGESIYTAQCAGCHSIDGSSGVGPTFEGLYGSEVEMDDGSTVLVDEDHLYEAITDPRATTRADFPDVMPSFSNLGDDEVNGLIAFIQTLE
jgi:cytochrome c oxidase subunit II